MQVLKGPKHITLCRDVQYTAQDVVSMLEPGAVLYVESDVDILEMATEEAPLPVLKKVCLPAGPVPALLLRLLRAEIVEVQQVDYMAPAAELFLEMTSLNLVGSALQQVHLNLELYPHLQRLSSYAPALRTLQLDGRVQTLIVQGTGQCCRVQAEAERLVLINFQLAAESCIQAHDASLVNMLASEASMQDSGLKHLSVTSAASVAKPWRCAWWQIPTLKQLTMSLDVYPLVRPLPRQETLPQLEKLTLQASYPYGRILLQQVLIACGDYKSFHLQASAEDDAWGKALWGGLSEQVQDLTLTGTLSKATWKRIAKLIAELPELRRVCAAEAVCTEPEHVLQAVREAKYLEYIQLRLYPADAKRLRRAVDALKVPTFDILVH